MPLDLFAIFGKLPVFALVASRLGGLLLFQPVLGALSIPFQIRALLILGLAALLTPLVALPTAAPDTPLGLALAMGAEILLGVLLGLASVVCFLGLQLAGLLIAQESGIAFGHIVDPTTEEEETVVGAFYLQLAAVVFLVAGGHRVVVTTCLDTFAKIPLLTPTTAADDGAALLVQSLALSGHVALRAAAPTMLALFLVNLVLGFVSRTMPQLNVLAVGFSLKSIVATILMAVSLPMAMGTFVDALDQVHGWIDQLLEP